ncbi:hypothetical protein TYRP_009656 [Tyrophagus putrescentiae]|nr:hypothetical protein TYRP_009656 [Tyrophagus putrescentiae]
MLADYMHFWGNYNSNLRDELLKVCSNVLCAMLMRAYEDASTTHRLRFIFAPRLLPVLCQ